MPVHVLVVDDNTFGAKTWAKAIEVESRGEFATEALFGGKACLERLKMEPHVDIVLLDIDMPEVSGADVIRDVIQCDPLPELKIVPLTGWGSNWIERWHLQDLRDTPTFKRIVHETCDKSNFEIDSMIETLRELTA